LFADELISRMTTIASSSAQDTVAGRAIEQESFATIDAEAGPHAYDRDQWPVVRRMIHASADFELNGLTAFHPGAVSAAIDALRTGGQPLVADVAMILAGLSPKRLAHFGLRPVQLIDDPEVAAAARAEGTTRAVQAMRAAWRRGLLDGALVAIGNAPTALIELVRLIERESVRPALVLGMPVGFVAAAESKSMLGKLDTVPWILIRGRKGGSTLAVAAIHALIALAESAGHAHVAPESSERSGAESGSQSTGESDREIHPEPVSPPHPDATASSDR
jgi:precorrin-8X/cobalt-precorrin-8 methylmutase